MKNILRLITLTLVSSVLLTGCFDESGQEITFSGEGSLAFVELNAASGTDVFTFLRANDGSEPSAGFFVTTSTGSAVNVTIAIDESSTAIEGLHYNIASTSVTIPADTYSAELPITVLPDNIEAGEQWTIVVNITDADVAINENFASATHTIQISCPPNIPEGTYVTSFPTAAEDPDGCETGFAYEDYEVTVTYDAGSETYTISDADIGYFAGDYEAPTKFINICDNLDIIGDSAAPYGISFVGSGIFIPDGGANGTGRIVFQCYYDATYAGSGATETIAFDAPAAL